LLLFLDPGSGIRDPGSEIRDPGWVKIRIRDKHRGSATLENLSLAHCVALSPPAPFYFLSMFCFAEFPDSTPSSGGANSKSPYKDLHQYLALCVWQLMELEGWGVGGKGGGGEGDCDFACVTVYTKVKGEFFGFFLFMSDIKH
jgi:hypothetical protein